MTVPATASGVVSAEPLDAERIRAAVPGGLRLGGLAVHGVVDSTNTWLTERSATLPSPYACLSEHQRAGRGRRGRTWVDSTGRDICLSLLRRFETVGALPQGLSLAVGVAAVRALEAVGARRVRLKWPNDIVWRDRKLGGILIEGSVFGTAWAAVIGVGINVGEVATPCPGPAPVHLESITGCNVSRNQLAALLIAEVLAECARFEAEGPAAALGEWRALDAMRGRAIRVETARGSFAGVAHGVDEAGELLVDAGGSIRRFVSAEVSLRAGMGQEWEDVA